MITSVPVITLLMLSFFAIAVILAFVKKINVGLLGIAFAIILAISYVLRQFQDLKVVQYAFNGIRAGVLVLMLKALLKLFKANRKGILPYALMGLSFVLTALLQVNTFLVIGLCAAVGLCAYLAKERRQEK